MGEKLMKVCPVCWGRGRRRDPLHAADTDMASCVECDGRGVVPVPISERELEESFGQLNALDD